MEGQGWGCPINGAERSCKLEQVGGKRGSVVGLVQAWALVRIVRSRCPPAAADMSGGPLSALSMSASSQVRVNANSRPRTFFPVFFCSIGTIFGKNYHISGTDSRTEMVHPFLESV